MQYEYAAQYTCVLVGQADDLDDGSALARIEDEIRDDLRERTSQMGGPAAEDVCDSALSGAYSCASSAIKYIDGEALIRTEHELALLFTQPDGNTTTGVFEGFVSFNASSVADDDARDAYLKYREGIYNDASACSTVPQFPGLSICTDVADASTRWIRAIDGCDTIVAVGGEPLVEMNRTFETNFAGYPFAVTEACVKGFGPEAFEEARSVLEEALAGTCDVSGGYNCSFVGLGYDTETGEVYSVSGDDSQFQVWADDAYTFYTTFPLEGATPTAGGIPNANDASVCAFESYPYTPTGGPLGMCYMVRDLQTLG